MRILVVSLFSSVYIPRLCKVVGQPWVHVTTLSIGEVTTIELSSRDSKVLSRKVAVKTRGQGLKCSDLNPPVYILREHTRESTRERVKLSCEVRCN